MVQLGKTTQLEGKTTQLEDVCLSSKKNKRHLLGGPERKTSGGPCEFFQAQVTIIKDGTMISQRNWCKIDFIGHTKLVGGFKYVLFSSLLGEDSHFD